MEVKVTVITKSMDNVKNKVDLVHPLIGDEDRVILVDDNDQQIGFMEKIRAHEQGLLHRAFSVFIFNSKGEMLLQQRAEHKYHSGGLWSNTCCSHPRPGEDIMEAAARRLREEMGFDTSLEKIYDFIYRAELNNNLTEHEFDHVLAGQYDGPVIFNTEEVKDVSYKNMLEIKMSIATQPEMFTEWFKITFPSIEKWWEHRSHTQSNPNPQP